MILKNFFDSSAIGAGPFETRVFATLDIDNSQEFWLELRLLDGSAVEASALEPRVRREVRAWIDESIEQYRAYESDMEAKYGSA